MKKQFNFVEELKVKLEQYNTINSEIEKLEANKEVIREQIDKWLSMHDASLFEVEDSTGQMWKISRTTVHKHRVKDYDLLKRVLDPKDRHLIVESDSETFSIRKILKHSKDWLLSLSE